MVRLVASGLRLVQHLNHVEPPPSARSRPFDLVTLAIAKQGSSYRRENGNLAFRYVSVGGKDEGVGGLSARVEVSDQHVRIHGDDVGRDISRLHDFRTVEFLR